MNYCLAAFCSGFIILYCYGILLPCAYPILAAICAIVLCTPRTALLLTLFFLGLALASFWANRQHQEVLPVELEGTLFNVTAILCSLPKTSPDYTRVSFCTQTRENIDSGNEQAWHRRLLLTTDHPVSRLMSQPQWTLQVALERPRATVNPVGLNFESYFFKEGIDATGRIESLTKSSGKLSVLQTVRWQLIRYRYALSEWLESYLHSREHRGLMRALLLGDRSQVSPEDDLRLSETGTQHLLAISGLHVGVLLLLFYRRLPQSMPWLAGISGVLFVYVVMMGFSPSAQRAWLMGSMGLLLRSGIVRVQGQSLLLYALLFVLILQPFSPLSMGFWYSFIAIAVLLLISWFRGQDINISAFLSIQVLILLALVPVNVFLGLPQSFNNILANLVAIPWISVVVLPTVLLCGVLSLISDFWANLGFVGVDVLLEVLMDYLDLLRASSVSLNSQGSAWVWLSWVLVLLALLVFQRISAMAVLLAGVLVAYATLPVRPDATEHELLVFDSGQGLALLFKSGDTTWIYDTGPAYRKSSVARNSILPYLRSIQSRPQIDGLIVSHGDLDHAGGTQTLLNYIEPGRLWLGQPERMFGAPNPEHCEQGMVWERTGLRLQVLFPVPGYLPGTSNNHSCVVMAELNGSRILIMGDLEGEAEKSFLRNYSESLVADVLIAGHHGSNNATRYALLKRVRPKHVVFSAGYRNRFGHPDERVLQRVRKFELRIYDTSQTGAIRFIPAPDNTSLNVRMMRAESAPFWIDSYAPEHE